MSTGTFNYRFGITVLLLTATLCLLAYIPALGLPFISDDYIQIALGRKYGPTSGWAELASDALYRCRATSLVLTWWLERWVGNSALTFNLFSLLLHILNTWLVFALGAWKPIGWRLSAVAAGFFAVYEGHQEAVVWFAAVPELLVFFFGLGSVLMWLLWLQQDRHWLLAGSGVFFLLALLSKESAAVLPAVYLATAIVERPRWKRIALASAPFFALSAVYAALAYANKPTHLHFNDGTFVLGAPVWATLAISTGRLFWFWGLLSVLAILGARAVNRRFLLGAAAVWILLTFLPYSFIAYMPRVPSRHTYLASAALSIIVGAGFLAARSRLGQWRQWAPAALAAVIVLHNCGYLWTKKQQQYIQRAEPTEALLRLGRTHSGPIVVRCFPYGFEVASTALELVTGRDSSQVSFNPTYSGGEAAVFCYDRMP